MFSVVSLVELLLIFIIVLIIFGAGKLPQLSRAGKAINGFKKSVHDTEEEAVQHSADPSTTVTELIQNHGA